MSDDPDHDQDKDGRVRRGQETREARRAQIKEDALRVFSDKGYHATSVSDLVDAAGVARGTFYLYFDSKDAIFLELVDDLVAHLRSNIVGIDLRSSAASMEDQLRATLVRVLRTVESNQPLTRIIFREAVGLDAVVDARLAAFDDELYGYVARSLQVGVALGAVRPTDTATTAACVVGAVREIVYRWIVRGGLPLDVDRVVKGVVDHHLRGLLPRS